MGATNGNINTNEKESHRQLPEKKALDGAGEVLIKEEHGTEFAFKTLYTGKPENERQLIVFIRHFFCGSCEEYVRALAKDLPPSALSAASTTLTIIGCGEPMCIPDYKKRTNCPFEIYCDPKQQIHKKLGMISNLSRSDKTPEYITKSWFNIVGSSFVNAIKSGRQALGNNGPASQNGGEWLFQNGELKWCHRMQDTTSHAETMELKEILGIPE